MKISPALDIENPNWSQEEQFEYSRGHILNEYRMYSYLKAINNATIEDYGIPAVYYYGEWEDCYLLALTLLDSEFPFSNLMTVDVLITLREYVSGTILSNSKGIES